MKTMPLHSRVVPPHRQEILALFRKNVRAALRLMMASIRVSRRSSDWTPNSLD